MTRLGRSPKWIPGLWLGFFGLACSAPAEKHEDPTIRRSPLPVLGGRASAVESVVLVMTERPSEISQCTGTLIAPRLLLTARHCVSSYVEGQYTCTINGNLDRSRTRSPANAGELGAVVDGSRVSVHVGREPDFSSPSAVGERVLALEADSICRNDIALVVLAEPALDVPTIPVRLGTGVVPGEEVTVIGYGLNEQKLNHRQELAGVEILGVGPSEYFELEGQAMPRTFVVGRSVCPGDSGGPALSTDDGKLVGVFSLLRGDCTSTEVRNFFTHVADFEGLLRSGYEAIDEPFVLDQQSPPPLPEGTAGSSAGDDGSKDGSSDDPQAPLEGDLRNTSGCAMQARTAPRGRLDWLAWLLLLGSIRRAWPARRDWSRARGAPVRSD